MSLKKEAFLEGTRSICNSLKEAKTLGVNVIVGGGDSIAALKNLEKKIGLAIFQQEEALFWKA